MTTNYKKELEELISTVISQNGSDLHIGAGRVPAIRVSGELTFLVKNPAFLKEDVLGILTEIIGQKKVEEFLEKQELDFSYDFHGEARLRGNAFMQKGMICIVLRLVPQVRNLQELNLPQILGDLAR